MKKALSILALIVLGQLNTYAQEKKEKETEIKKPSRDFVMIQVHHDGWHLPNGEKLGISGIGRGMSGYLMYDFPIGQKENTNFSFATGLGIGSNNVFFKNTLPNLKGTSDTLYVIPTDSTWKGNKFNTTFLEMPLELRFFGNKNNRNKGFKMAIGAKVGLILGAHTKYREPIGGTYVIQKDAAKKFNQSWRLAPTIRIGYGNFSIFAQYGVTGVFNTNRGPAAHAYSIGLTITGL